MPKFTLIKHADNDYDTEVTVEFTADVLDLARAHYEDFLRGAGFDMPDSSTQLYSEWLDKAEDDMWNEAFDFKFRNDGPVGTAGADILPFPSSDK